MKYNNRLFPHPVLGIEDDIVNGVFGVELGYKSDAEHICITPTFKITEDRMMNLVTTNQAVIIIHVYCRATMFREVFTTTTTICQPILIPAFKLRGDVEIDFFVCAVKQIEKYSSPNFNSEYNDSSFSIDSSDILAYGGKGKFIANKTFDELRSISSLIRIKNSNQHSKPMFNEYDAEKIEINLCEEDYLRYQDVLRGGHWVNIVHSTIVLPALIDALYFMEKPESGDCSHRRWYKALADIKTKSTGTADCFRIAQNILDLPNNRTFETLLKEME